MLKINTLSKNSWFIFSLTGLIGFCFIYILHYGFNKGITLTARYAPLVDAAMEIKLEATTAHLWFEEILSGDRHEDIKEVWDHLEQADWYANAMLEGGKNQEGMFLPLKNEKIRNEIKLVRTKLNKFREITLKRYEKMSTSSAGTEIDQTYDLLFMDFINQVDLVETELQKLIFIDLKKFRITEMILLTCTLLISLIIGFILFRNEKKKQVYIHQLEKHHRHLEEMIEDRTEQLEKSNRELKEFAYIVSHDLKAPLRAISQLSYWISKDYKDVFDDNGKKKLSLLGSRVKRMDALIDGILQYSRVGKVLAKESKIDLNVIVKDIIDNIDVPKNIKIKIENELPEYIGDKTRFTQIFQNLISNSIKFIDKQEGRINISCIDKVNHWIFLVQDNGPGIEEKYFDKAFQFFQTLQSRDEHEGTGVGLSLVKKIITIYKGKIWLESQIGEGLKVFFTLPKI